MDAATQKTMFSSAKSDWETPDALYTWMDREFHFQLDVCATQENAKCDVYIGPEQDALSTPWPGRCWMNPPYGREIGKWVKRAWEEVYLRENAELVVALLPSRTDTKWWHIYVSCAAEVRFIVGRLKFKGASAPAPFPSAIVVFRHTVQSTRYSYMKATK